MIFGKRKSRPEFTQHPYSDLPLLLVSGFGRSGTTVLRNCLAAHPEIDSCNRECNYICDVIRTAETAMQHPNRRENLNVRESDFWALHRQLVLHLAWPQPKRSGDYPRALSTYSMLTPQAADGLRSTFPGVVIVFIVRNGIEVVSSYRSFPAFAHLEFEQVCKMWALKYDMVDYCESHDRCFVLRYECLADSEKLQQTLSRPLQTIGIEFHPDCLQPLSRRYHPTQFPGESDAATRDLQHRSERWQFWTEEQKVVFATDCSSTMSKLGYPIPWLA